MKDANGTTTWVKPATTTQVIPNAAGNVLIPYEKQKPTTDTPTTDSQVDYKVEPVDESMNALADPVAASGLAGEVADTSGLADSYKDAKGKTWYKPAQSQLASYMVPKAGGILQVLYTDQDTTGDDTQTPDTTGSITITDNGDGTWTIHYPDGKTEIVTPGDHTGDTTTEPTGTDNNGGYFIINPDGTITFVDKNGKQLTLDPSKFGNDGKPITVTINNNNNNTNTNDNGNGNGQNGGTTGTTTGDTDKPVTIVLPGQDGKSTGITVEKHSDGSYTVHYPDGSSETIKAGDNDTHTTPAGGTFVVNQMGRSLSLILMARQQRLILTTPLLVPLNQVARLQTLSCQGLMVRMVRMLAIKR